MDPWFQNFKLFLSYWLMSINRDMEDTNHPQPHASQLPPLTSPPASSAMDFSPPVSLNSIVEMAQSVHMGERQGSSQAALSQSPPQPQPDTTLNTPERQFLCSQCFKPFKSKQQLAQHSLVHTGLRKYTCTYCEKAFKQLCHLQQHTRIHTGEKPYRCMLDGCERSFAQLSNLQHHMRNHEEQVKKASSRHFSCVICHRSYTNESSLKSHTLKMHVHIKPLEVKDAAVSHQHKRSKNNSISLQLQRSPSENSNKPDLQLTHDSNKCDIEAAQDKQIRGDLRDSEDADLILVSSSISEPPIISSSHDCRRHGILPLNSPPRVDNHASRLFPQHLNLAPHSHGNMYSESITTRPPTPSSLCQRLYHSHPGHQPMLGSSSFSPSIMGKSCTANTSMSQRLTEAMSFTPLD